MRRRVGMAVLLAMALVSSLPGCGAGEAEERQSSPEAQQTIAHEDESSVGQADQEVEAAGHVEQGTAEVQKEYDMRLSIDSVEVEVLWEDNESVAALRDMASGGALSVQMSRYGGFEQVGPLGRDLPSDDVRTTTDAGDIVLYAGNQIVVFYGSNTWAYTRLGHIVDCDAGELAELLGGGDVVLTITVG